MRIAVWTLLGTLALGFITVDVAAQYRPGGRRRPASTRSSAPRPGVTRSTQVETPPAIATRQPKQTEQDTLSRAEAEFERLVKRALRHPEALALPRQLLEIAQLYPALLARLQGSLANLSQGASAEAIASLLLQENLLRQLGNVSQADALLMQIEEHSAASAPLLERAAVRAQERGDGTKANNLFARLLGQTHNAANRRTLLEKLRNAALADERIDDAQRYHEQLRTEGALSPALDARWARHLLEHHRLQEASVLTLGLCQDSRLAKLDCARLLRDLAELEMAEGNATEAEGHLEQARRLTERQEPLATEVDTLLAEAGRVTAHLPAVIARLAASGKRSPQSTRLLAALYLETGQIELSLKLLRQAQDHDGADLEVNQLLCQALDIAGHLDEADRCLESLARRHPNRLELTLRWLDRLVSRNERERAALYLKGAERNLGRSPATLTALADAWERLGEREKAGALLKLAPESFVSPPSAPLHTGAALDWLSQAETEVETGDVEHAVSLIEQALPRAPRTEGILTRCAKVYERAVINGKSRDETYYDKAEGLWVELLRTEALGDASRTMAIERIVRMWSLRGLLPNRTDALARQHRQGSATLTQTLWLAEAQIRLGRFGAATEVLTSALAKAERPWQLLRRLEQLAVLSGRFTQAMDYAERRLLAPTPADRPSYSTLIEYATRSASEAKAMLYAKRWTQALPSASEAWATLSQLERQQQHPKESRDALLHAYQLDLNRYDYLLELSSFQIEDELPHLAFEGLLRILRNDSDELRLARAYHLATPLATTSADTLRLEQALSAGMSRNPRATELRSALLALYARLLGEANDKNPSANATVLVRATLLLVSSLSDPRESVQETALSLLERQPTAQAAPALLRFAQQHADTRHAVRALVLLGRIRSPTTVLPLVTWLRNTDILKNESPASFAAIACLAHFNDPLSAELLRSLLSEHLPSTVALSALALATRRDTASVPLLLRRKGREEPPLIRAAVLFALQALSPRSIDKSDLLDNPRNRLERLVQVAILANASIAGRATAIAERLCDNAFDSHKFANASVAATEPRTGNQASLWQRHTERADVEAFLVELTQHEPTPKARLGAFLNLLESLSQACRRQVTLDPEHARHLGRAILRDEARLDLGPLVPPPAMLSQEEQQERKAAIDRWLGVVISGFERYRDHADAELREIALGLLALGRGDEKALIAALADENTQMREKAIGWSRATSGPLILNAIAKRLAVERDPAVRIVAAKRLGEAPAGQLSNNAWFALKKAARNDPHAAVRMAALSSLYRTNPLAAAQELSYCVATDAEPETRALARKLLESRP